VGKPTTESTKEFAALCIEALPDWYGIETGTLVLDPVGLAAVPTSRLVVREENPAPATLESLLRTILTRNHTRNVPTLCQLLVRTTATEQFAVTVRVAELGVARRPLGRYGLASSLTSPAHCPIDTETPAEITSSRCLADDDWESELERTRNRTPGLAVRDVFTPASQSAMVSARLRRSSHEFAALLEGSAGLDPYESLPVTPTLSVSREQLEALLDVTPHYESCCWPANPARSAPRFIRETIHTRAAGTDHDSVLAGPTQPLPQSGIQDGASITEFVDGWLAERGIDRESVTDRTRGDPHLRGHPHDDAGPVVVVDPNHDGTADVIMTAGELIMTANQARREDTHLLVVTPSEQTAAWARDVLTAPFVRRRGDDYQLYTLPTCVFNKRGEFIFTPRRSEPLYWVVSGDDHRALYHGDQRLASGPATAPIRSYSFETPRVTKQDESLIVTTPDGGDQSRFASKEALGAAYRPVPNPILPIRPLFCADVTVVSRVGSSLREPPAPLQQIEETGQRRRKAHWQHALAEFLELYTRQTYTPTPGDEQSAPRFTERFRSWYDGHSTRVTPSRLSVADLIPQGRSRSDITDTGALTRHSWWTPAEPLSLALAHGQAGDRPATADHPHSN